MPSRLHFLVYILSHYLHTKSSNISCRISGVRRPSDEVGIPSLTLSLGLLGMRAHHTPDRFVMANSYPPLPPPEVVVFRRFPQLLSRRQIMLDSTSNNIGILMMLCVHIDYVIVSDYLKCCSLLKGEAGVRGRKGVVADNVLALKQSSEHGRKGERCHYLLRGIIQPNTGEEGGGRDSDDDDGEMPKRLRINRHVMGRKGRISAKLMPY